MKRPYTYWKFDKDFQGSLKGVAPTINFERSWTFGKEQDIIENNSRGSCLKQGSSKTASSPQVLLSLSKNSNYYEPYELDEPPKWHRDLAPIAEAKCESSPPESKGNIITMREVYRHPDARD